MNRHETLFGKRSTRALPERRVLIICEGTKTEPQYFEAFDLNKELIDVKVIGTGKNTDSLVKHAIDLKEKADKNIPYSHVWCVFDRDSFQAQQFNQAIQRAVSNGIQVAYSNEAFEFWYILHFEYLQAGLNREKYKNKLTGHLKKEYKKNDPGIYQQLLDKQPKAIKWAQMLIDEKGSKHNPEKDNPCTNVHRLVIFLNEYLNIPNNDRNQQT